MNDRAVAADLLRRVRTGGAYGNVVVDRATGDRDERSRAAIRGDVYGALRWSGELEYVLKHALDRDLSRLQAEVLHVLLVGAYELLHTSLPPASVVSASVDAVREAGAPRAAGLVNAVLRSVAAQGRPDLPIAEAAGIPAWVIDRLGAAWGSDEVEAFVSASNRPARVGIRLRPGEDPPEGGRPVPGIPEAVLVEAPVPGRAIQDPASVAVVSALYVGAGHLVADVGAAPGGKTAHLLDLAGAGRVVAVERHVRRAATGARRVPAASWVVADGRRPPLMQGRFDRVLLDAPCTGLGTLRRRPEIRHRVTLDDVTRLAILQGELLEAAMGLVAPGGRLVYSVCTVMPEETTDVVAGRGFRAPDGLPGRPAGDGWLLAPHLAETDGMFIAHWDR